jgi:cupin 2 domain-containing protein
MKLGRKTPVCGTWSSLPGGAAGAARLEADLTGTTSNLFADLPSELPDELIQTLVAAPNVCIERIVSHGHASPPGFWYDQDEAEWVVVLKGAARLRFEGDGQPVEMRPGDFVNIPAHRRHRVEWTTPNEPTVWLAVFYRG